MNAPFSRTLQYTIGVSFNPYLYGSKEYLTTGGANLLDFTARTYDPSTLLFHTQDQKATDYTPLNSYLYCGSDPVNRVDWDGKDARVIFDEKSITVQSVIFLTGDHATDDLARIFYDDIMNTWGQIDKYSYDGKTYDVKWDVSVRVKGDEAVEYNGVNNYMEVIMDGTKASYVIGTNHGIIRAVSGMGLSLSDDCPISHEFGHMLGLIDQYDKDAYEAPEWANDIMAEPAYQLKIISNHHLETLFNPVINLHKIYDTFRNVPILNRYLPNRTIYWINHKTRPEKIRPKKTKL